MSGRNYRFLVWGIICAYLVGCAPPPIKVLDDGERSPKVARQAQIVVAQEEINPPVPTTTNYFVLCSGCGLLGAILVAVISSAISAGISDAENDMRTSKDRERIQPLRDALVGYDFRQPAFDASKQVLRDTSWLGITTIDISSSPTDIRQWLDQAQTPEGLIYTYRYALAGDDLQAIEVSALASLFPTTVPSGGDPKDRLRPIFSTEVRCTFELANSGSPKENISQWAANDAALAKLGLQTCLKTCSARMPSLMERAFNATPNELKEFEDRKARWLDKSVAYPVHDEGGEELLYVPPNGWFLSVSAQAPRSPSQSPMIVTVPFPLSDSHQRASGQWSDPSILSDLAKRTTDGVTVAELQMRGQRSEDRASLHIGVRGKFDNAPGHDKQVNLKFEILNGESSLAAGSVEGIKVPERRTRTFEGGFEVPVAALPETSALTMRLTLVDYDY